MLGSGLLSGFLSIWSKSIEDRHKANEMAMKLLAKRQAGIRQARESQGGGTNGFSITRRIIALSSVFSIIVLPLLVAAFTTVPVTFGYTEFHPGFLFFKGKEVLTWVTHSGGFVITPLHTHTVMAILGLYFGHSIVKR